MEQYLHLGVPEEEEREKGIESVFEEIIAVNFPKLGEEIIAQTMEAHRMPKRRDPWRTTPRHIIIKGKDQGQGQSIKGSQREKKGHLQRKTHQALIRLLNRNLTGQKRMA